MSHNVHLSGNFLERFLAYTLTRWEERAIKEHIDAGPCKECEQGIDGLDVDTDSGEPEDPEVVERFQDVMRRMRKGARKSPARTPGVRGRINVPPDKN